MTDKKYNQFFIASYQIKRYDYYRKYLYLNKKNKDPLLAIAK